MVSFISFKKIIYVSFKFSCFYNPDTIENIFKIIIPLDILNYFIKIIKKTYSLFLKFYKQKNKEQKNEILNK